MICDACGKEVKALYDNPDKNCRGTLHGVCRACRFDLDPTPIHEQDIAERLFHVGQDPGHRTHIDPEWCLEAVEKIDRLRAEIRELQWELK